MLRWLFAKSSIAPVLSNIESMISRCLLLGEVFQQLRPGSNFLMCRVQVYTTRLLEFSTNCTYTE